MAGKSEYTKFVKECMLDMPDDMSQPEKMRQCAAMWREMKGTKGEPMPKVKEVPLNCKRIIMLTDGDNDDCRAVAEAFRPELAAGQLEILDIEKEEGQAMAEQLETDGVPCFVCVLDDGNLREIQPKDVVAHILKKDGVEG